MIFDDWWDYALVIGCSCLIVLISILLCLRCRKPSSDKNETPNWGTTPLTEDTPGDVPLAGLPPSEYSSPDQFSKRDIYHSGGSPQKKLIIKKLPGEFIGFVLRRPSPLEIIRAEGAVANIRRHLHNSILTKVDSKRLTLKEIRTYMKANTAFTITIKTSSMEHKTFPISRPSLDSPLGLVLHEALVIERIVKNSPADVAGLSAYVGWDITRLNGTELTSIEHYDELINNINSSKIFSVGLTKRPHEDLYSLASSSASSSSSSDEDILGRTLSTLPDFICEPETYPDNITLLVVIRSLGFLHLVNQIKRSRLTIGSATENNLSLVGATKVEIEAIFAAIGKGAHVLGIKRDLAQP